MPTLTAARFALSIDGQSIGQFSELNGITTEVETIDYVESGDHESVFLNRFCTARIPIAIRFARFATPDPRFSAWYLSANVNRISAARNCSLTLYNSGGGPIARYSLESAWPSKIEISNLGSERERLSGKEIVTIACKFLRRVGI